MHYEISIFCLAVSAVFITAAFYIAAVKMASISDRKGEDLWFS